MDDKSKDDFYRDWNMFSDMIVGMDEAFFKTMIDYGIETNFTIHNNVPNSALGLGDVGMANVFYTPQEIYPCMVNDDKVVLSAPDGVWIGKNKEAAQILNSREYVMKKVEPENVLITSKLIKNHKSPNFIWKYLTGEDLYDNRLSKPYSGKKLGLKKSDYVEAAYFMWGERDPRKCLRNETPRTFLERLFGVEKNHNPPTMDWVLLHHQEI
jgi:hypothetical protein